jgi:hypothetical protein
MAAIQVDNLAALPALIDTIKQAVDAVLTIMLASEY